MRAHIAAHTIHTPAVMGREEEMRDKQLHICLEHQSLAIMANHLEDMFLL